MNLNKMTIEDIQVQGKKVLVRCDFNVPLDADKNITDETRINAALPTIKYLLDNGAAVILCSHLGRPKGTFNMEFSLAPVAKRLSEKLGFEVKIQCVVPFVECLITKVTVDTEHVISDFVIAQSIFGSGIQVVLYFQ